VHLGYLISDKLDDSCDISQRRCDFIVQVNNVSCYFQKLSSAVKYKLFQFYCTSFYGCELWDLACHKMADFVLLGGRVLGDYGIYRQTHTVMFYRYSASVFLRFMRSVGVQ